MRALAKRYIAEVGSDTVNALFAAVPPAQMVTTILGYSETFAALLRKHNQRLLPAQRSWRPNLPYATK
jgi:hypothetical protein